MQASPPRKEILSVRKHWLAYDVGQAISPTVDFWMIPLYAGNLAPAAKYVFGQPKSEFLPQGGGS